jgi:hypothetical protein
MSIFVLALSRLVPISFLISLTLIGSRYLHDLVWRTRPEAARWAFAAVSFVGLIATMPYAFRAGLIIDSTLTASRGQWAKTDALLTVYDSWDGHWSETGLREWAFARMNRGDWAGAEKVLRMSEKQSAQTNILIGVCQYYEGNPAAEATLAAVPNASGTQLCLRDYILARIAQKRGDFARAFQLYGQSAVWEPDFFPSVYHGVRLSLLKHDPRLAARILDRFVRQFPTNAADRDVTILRQNIAANSIPPDKEFVVVSD